ncbi:MFS general substrate transporter [Microthyrium microscopicum]|uniref:MFS general substrate transporter n=1 Tax=Microthyrium microscopicum TaxID=703497 RepID=A0A6A6TYM9_9PEZI|nr:MFS general substrate transporter [Microthyrium microscopicum]
MENSKERNDWVDLPKGDGEVDDDLQVQCPSHTTERKLVTKIDLHVLPFLCIMYLLAFLDRVNIANANLFGLSDELHLKTDNRYNIALVIFFVPYIIFEIPSNMFLKRFKPRVWLATCMFLFGLTSICQGLVKSYGGLLASRFFLGLFETGMFPGCFYLIGMWYRRHEAQRRYTMFFSSTSLAGAFGGLLASAIGKMDGMRGYRGWRWIFILEGVLTCVVSLFFFFWLPNFPEESKWLTEDERAYVKARLEQDQGKSAAERQIAFKDVINVFKDIKIVLGGFMYFGLIVTAYGYAYFSPAIIQSYGYSPIQTQLHSVPPWAAAFVFGMIVAYFSDKAKHRYLFAVFSIFITIAGFAILLTLHDVKAHRNPMYAALFLVAMGAYTAMPIIVCWFNMNLGGHHRRAVGSAWQVGFGNAGGIIAVFAFLAKDAPRYTTGYSICVAFACLSILSCTAYGVLCYSQNRKRDRAVHDRSLTTYEKTELGDMSPDYRYLL